MKQNKDKEIRMLFWIAVGIIVLLGGLAIWNSIKLVDAEQELQSCQDNLGYYEGDLKPYGDFVNVTCRIPKEVIEKNWIYQIYVIADNKTCRVLSE